MDDILSGIESVGCFSKLRVTLRFPRLRIHLDQVDPGIHTLILKSMGKCHFRLLLIGVGERERIDVVLVSEIVLRSLDLLHVVAVVQRKIRLIDSTAVRSRCYLLDKGILLHDHFAVHRLDVSTGVETVDSSGKRILRGIILLHDRHFCLLAVVSDRDAAKHHFAFQFIQGQGDILALPVQDKVLRSTGFLHGIGPKKQVVE